MIIRCWSCWWLWWYAGLFQAKKALDARHLLGLQVSRHHHHNYYIIIIKIIIIIITMVTIIIIIMFARFRSELIPIKSKFILSISLGELVLHCNYPLTIIISISLIGPFDHIWQYSTMSFDDHLHNNDYNDYYVLSCLVDHALDHPQRVFLKSLSNECFTLDRFSSEVRPSPSSPPSSFFLSSVSSEQWGCTCTCLAMSSSSTSIASQKCGLSSQYWRLSWHPLSGVLQIYMMMIWWWWWW